MESCAKDPYASSMCQPTPDHGMQPSTQRAVPLQTRHAAVLWNSPCLNRWPGRMFACCKICDTRDSDSFLDPAGLLVNERQQSLPAAYSLSPCCSPLHTGMRVATPSEVEGGRTAVQPFGKFLFTLCAPAAADAALQTDTICPAALNGRREKGLSEPPGLWPCTAGWG